MPFGAWEKVFLYCEPREYLRLRSVCKFFNAKIREQKWWKVLDLRRYQGIEDVVRALESNEHKGDQLENVLLPKVQLGHSRESTLLLHRLGHSLAYCLKELRIELFNDLRLDESNAPLGGVTLMALRVLSVKFEGAKSPWNISPSVRAFIHGLNAPHCDTLEVELRTFDPITARAQWIIVSKIVSGMTQLTTLKITLTNWVKRLSECEVLSVTTEMISSLLTNQECLLTELQNIHLYDTDVALVYGSVLARLAVILTDDISVGLRRDVHAEVKSIVARLKWSVVVGTWRIGEAEDDWRLIRDSQVKLQNVLGHDVMEDTLDANGSTVRWRGLDVDVSPKSLRSLYRVRHYVSETLRLVFEPLWMRYGSPRSFNEVIVLPNVSRLKLENLNPFDTKHRDVVRRLDLRSPHTGRELRLEVRRNSFLRDDGREQKDIGDVDRWKDAVEQLIASCAGLRTARLSVDVSYLEYLTRARRHQ